MNHNPRLVVEGPLQPLMLKDERYYYLNPAWIFKININSLI